MEMPGQREAKVYAAGQRLTSGSIDLLMRCLDRMMDAASRHDSEGVSSALDNLENALRPEEYPSLGWKLVKLYAYQRWCLKGDRFEEVCRTAEILKDLWEAALTAPMEVGVSEEPGDGVLD